MGSPDQPAVPYNLILPLTYSPCYNLCKLCIFNFSCNTWSCVRCSHWETTSAPTCWYYFSLVFEQCTSHRLLQADQWQLAVPNKFIAAIPDAHHTSPGSPKLAAYHQPLATCSHTASIILPSTVPGTSTRDDAPHAPGRPHPVSASRSSFLPPAACWVQAAMAGLAPGKEPRAMQDESGATRRRTACSRWLPFFCCLTQMSAPLGTGPATTGTGHKYAGAQC